MRPRGSTSAARALLRQALGACADLQLPEVEVDGDAARDATRADAGIGRLATAGALALTSPPGASAASVATSMRTPEDAATAAEIGARLATLLAKLPERSQRVVSLRYGVDRSLREVSKELAVSYATVRRDHDEALDTLRAGVSHRP